ncbi:hypothetical protein B296_00030067 [Ensete ventricosum]|uniref:Uncharacterized protein n=1 Tax=Ensete ventricosum TaxID=4639 RepID=A0A426Y2J8_ENSVE|nr:hypothetical protein B296_00030067 [Ensete ventricosum]
MQISNPPEESPRNLEPDWALALSSILELVSLLRGLKQGKQLIYRKDPQSPRERGKPPRFPLPSSPSTPPVPIVPLSFGGVAPDDSGATQALATMQSCFDVDSTVMARRLIEVRKHYYIPSEYELHVPLPGQRPYDAFSSGFSLDHFHFQGVRDMNKAWLAEAGLSPAPREMFNLRKMKYGGGVSSRSTALSMTSVSTTTGVVVYTAKKRLGTNEGAGLKKHSKRATLE